MTILVMGLSACTHSPQNVLEPVESENQVTVQSVQSPTFLKLQEVLQRNGYEGVGMSYESEESLALLLKVFSEPKTGSRKIRLVYTGLQMAYDPKYESLTIGGTSDSSQIIFFIEKNISLRKEGQVLETPVPSVLPTTPSSPPSLQISPVITP